MKTNRLTFLSIILLLTFWTNVSALYSQQVDTVEVYSQKMKATVKNVIILPAQYAEDPSLQFPVVYLLHGYGGNHATWIKNVKPNLPQIASDLKMIIVCPDGKNSWYWDSPINPKSQYQTYVGQELVNYVDSSYNTIKSPKGRAITGLSMGGHGALWLTSQYPDTFGACGSMSGGVDIRPFPENWAMPQFLGKYVDNKALWDQHTVINQVDTFLEHKTPIIVDCGQDDFFLQVNEDLHATLLKKKIQHTYIITSGKHDGKYWRKAINWQLGFFEKFFYPENK